MPGTAAVSGSITLGGQEIVGADDATLNALRAEHVGMVFQDPTQALNPYIPIGDQLRRILIQHGLADGSDADQRVMHMLDRVGLPDAARQFRAYAHQLSGGMRQRVMIASALIAAPDLLIADEPTTALDVTVQAQILELLERIRDDTALLLITHDLAIVAGHCERMLVLQDGKLIEEGKTRKLFSAPATEHTRALIDAAPRVDTAASPQPVSGEPLLDVDNVSVSFQERDRQRQLHAVQDINLELREGETIAIVGESGSGKSTLARSVLGLIPMRTGRVVFCGKAIEGPVQSRAIETRRDLQLVFQDPAGSLDPQMRVERIVAEPLAVHAPDLDGEARKARVISMLERVGLSDAFLQRFPHELSGGQAQRVAIARALYQDPRVLLADEPVSSVDPARARDTVELLTRIAQEEDLTLCMSLHNLELAKAFTSRRAL